MLRVYPGSQSHLINNTCIGVISGLYWGCIRVIIRLYNPGALKNGKENGNSYRV